MEPGRTEVFGKHYLSTKINILNTILNLANDFCLVFGLSLNFNTSALEKSPLKFVIPIVKSPNVRRTMVRCYTAS